MLIKIMNYLRTPYGQRNTLIVIIIAIVIFFNGCGDGNTDIDMMEYKQNLSALQDKVRNYETKNGTLIYEKKALLGNISEVSKMNKELKKDIKDLEDHPIVITKFKTKIIHDTLKMEVTGGEATFTDGKKIVPFPFDTTIKHNDQNYRTLAGKYIITVDSSLNMTSIFQIDKDEMAMSFTTGITENDNKEVEIFIKSDYPNFTPSGIDGAIIDPTKSEVIKSYFPTKRWGLSPYIGYGFYADFNKGIVGTGLNGGISLSYDIYQWQKMGKK
jgi:hypothetical protein